MRGGASRHGTEGNNERYINTGLVSAPPSLDTDTLGGTNPQQQRFSGTASEPTAAAAPLHQNSNPPIRPKERHSRNSYQPSTAVAYLRYRRLPFRKLTYPSIIPVAIQIFATARTRCEFNITIGDTVSPDIRLGTTRPIGSHGCDAVAVHRSTTTSSVGVAMHSRTLPSAGASNGSRS